MKMSASESSAEMCSQEEQLQTKKHPDYCRTITFTDNNGVLRELVFPKALDLDRPKRARTTFSRGQLDKLESEFTANQYLVGRERSQLARTLGLSETQVKVWFQNRRTKHKRDKEKQAEHQEAKAESMATQKLLQILQPPSGGKSSPGHSSSPSELTALSPRTLMPVLPAQQQLPLPNSPGSLNAIPPAFKFGTQPHQEQRVSRLVDAVQPPLNPALHGFSAAASQQNHNALACLPDRSMCSLALHPESSSGVCVGYGGGALPAMPRGQIPASYGVVTNEAWVPEPYLLGPALHVRFPPAWSMYPHMPQSLT